MYEGGKEVGDKY